MLPVGRQPLFVHAYELRLQRTARHHTEEDALFAVQRARVATAAYESQRKGVGGVFNGVQRCSTVYQCGGRGGAMTKRKRTGVGGVVRQGVGTP